MTLPVGSRYCRNVVQRDFVLQLKPTSDPMHNDFRGRIEHIDSGRAASFRTLEELAAAIARLLASTESQSSDS
jgi:hypothetical protein